MGVIIAVVRQILLRIKILFLWSIFLVQWVKKERIFFIHLALLNLNSHFSGMCLSRRVNKLCKPLIGFRQSNLVEKFIQSSVIESMFFISIQMRFICNHPRWHKITLILIYVWMTPMTHWPVKLNESKLSAFCSGIYSHILSLLIRKYWEFNLGLWNLSWTKISLQTEHFLLIFSLYK